MITLPFTDDNGSMAALQAGTHLAKLDRVTFNQKLNKLIIEYVSNDNAGFFSDFLGFATAAQSKRTFALVCRLHELAGMAAPTNGQFDEKALVETHKKKNTVMNLHLEAKEGPDGRIFVNLADFPTAAGEDLAF